MTIAIQELRPESLAEAVEFAGGCGCQVEGDRVAPGLSLVAVEDDRLVATALCVEQENARHRLEVGIQDVATRGDLHRALVDKALMKLSAAGVRKFDIRANGSDEQRDFWHAVSWIDRMLNETKPSNPQNAVERPSAGLGEVELTARPQGVSGSPAGLGGVDEAA